MKIKIICVSAILAVSSGVAQGFDMPGGLGGIGAAKSQGSGNVEQDIKDFLTTATEAADLLDKSSNVLFKAVSTKEEIDAHDEKVKAASAIADPKEKDAALKKVRDDQQAALAKVDYAAKAAEMKKGMDKKKQEQVGASIYNFTLGMLKDKELMDKGNGLVSSASSNPMVISKLSGVKDVISSISSQMGNIGKIASGIQKLSSVVKLDKMPTKASEPAKAVAGD